MNKKGLIGKIFLVIGILILIIGAIAGITAYQLYNLAMLAKEETAKIQEESAEINKGDCSKVQSIENRMNNLMNEAGSACKNPVIKYIFAKQTIKTENLGTLNCDTLNQLKEQASSSMQEVKTLCANQTIMNAIKKQTASKTNISN